VTAVVQKGYLLNGRLVRPALVIVSSRGLADNRLETGRVFPQLDRQRSAPNGARQKFNAEITSYG
jgi:hypothetical protein